MVVVWRIERGRGQTPVNDIVVLPVDVRGMPKEETPGVTNWLRASIESALPEGGKAINVEVVYLTRKRSRTVKHLSAIVTYIVRTDQKIATKEYLETKKFGNQLKEAYIRRAPDYRIVIDSEMFRIQIGPDEATLSPTEAGTLAPTEALVSPVESVFVTMEGLPRYGQNSLQIENLKDLLRTAFDSAAESALLRDIDITYEGKDAKSDVGIAIVEFIIQRLDGEIPKDFFSSVNFLLELELGCLENAAQFEIDLDEDTFEVYASDVDG